MKLIYLASYITGTLTGLYLLSVIWGMFTDKKPEASNETD